MRVLVFGGTGAMGVLLIRKALAAGYIVTAYVRSPSKLPEGTFILLPYLVVANNFD